MEKRYIEHRVTLGTKERQLLEDWVNSNSFNKIAEPIVAGMSDVSFVLTVGAIIAIWFPNIVLPDILTETTTAEVIEAIDKGVQEHVKDPLVAGPSAAFGIAFGQWATDLLKEFLNLEDEASG